MLCSMTMCYNFLGLVAISKSNSRGSEVDLLNGFAVDSGRGVEIVAWLGFCEEMFVKKCARIHAD